MKNGFSLLLTSCLAASCCAEAFVSFEMPAFIPEDKEFAPRFECAAPGELGLPAPAVRSLDGMWKLAKADVSKTPFPEEPDADELPRKAPEFDDSEWFDQRVPYDLYCCDAYPKRNNMWPNTDFPYSRAWYRREFTMSDAEAKGACFLHFGAVAWKAIVYVNGIEAGRHHGEFTAFDIDVSGIVKPGRNTLAVRVLSDLGPRNTNGIIKDADHPYGCQWWIATYRGGITESVELVVNERAGFRSIRTTPRFDEGVLEVDWTSTEPLDGCEISAAIVDAGRTGGAKKAGAVSGVAASGISGTLTIPVSKDIVPWEIGSAHLYYVSLVAGKNGERLASGVSRFGWRKVEIKNGGFYLNGVRRFLFGANINSVDYIPYGDPSKPAGLLGRSETPERIDARIDDFFTHALAGGTVIARTAHQPIGERVLSAADEYGYMIMYEHGWCFSSKLKFPDFRDNSLSELHDMLEIAYRHPSVVGWSLGNEVPYYQGEAAKLAVEMYDWLKANDKHGRPVSPQSGDFSGPTFVKTDICDFHDYTGQATDWLGFRKGLDDYRAGKEKKYGDPELFNSRAIALGFETVGYTWNVDEDKSFERGNLQHYLAYAKKDSRWGTPNGIGCAGTVPLFKAVGPDASNACLGWMGKRVFELIRNHGWWQGYAAWSATPLHCWRQWTQEVYPTLAVPGGDIPPTHPFAWEKTEYTVRVHNSRDAVLRGAVLKFSLATLSGDETDLGELRVPDLAGFTSFEGEVSLVFPETLNEAQLRLRVVADGEVVGRNFYDVSARSRKAVTAPVAAKREAFVLATDSEANVKATVELLARYGVKAGTIASFDDAKENSVVVIPFERENQGVELPDAAMEKLGGNGVTVLMLEQNSSAAFLPAGMNVFDGPLSFSDMVLPEHPVFAGLGWKDFDVWNNTHGGRVVNFYVGPANEAMLACHGGTLYAPKKIGATLLEGRVGKGRFIASQLLAVDSAATDSAAARYLRNLLEYVFAAEPVDARELKIKLDSGTVGETVRIPMDPLVLKGDKTPDKPARATVKIGGKYAKIRVVHSAGFPNKTDKVMTYRFKLEGAKTIDWTIECGRTVSDVGARVRPLAAKPVRLDDGRWGYEAVWENPEEDLEIESVEIIAACENKGAGDDWREVTFPVPYVWSITGEKFLPETGWLESTRIGKMGQQFGWKGPANRAMKAAVANGKRLVMGSFKVKPDGELEFLNNCGCTVDGDGNFEAKAWLLDKEGFIEGGEFAFRIMDSNWSRVYAETRFKRAKEVSNRAVVKKASGEFAKLTGRKVKVTIKADGVNVPAETRVPFATKWDAPDGKTVWKQPFWRDMFPAGDFKDFSVTHSIPIEIPADAANVALTLGDLAEPAKIVYTEITVEELPAQ